MLVARKDLRALTQRMLDGIGYGANHVLYKLGEVISRPSDVRIMMDMNDVSEYLAGQPYDKHEFVIGSLRSHYEALALVAHRKIAMKDAAVSEKDFRPYIDVPKLV